MAAPWVVRAPKPLLKIRIENISPNFLPVLTLTTLLKPNISRDASYETLAEIIRHKFTNPKETLEELFSRLVFNILCGNTDDHARNHSAFWDGTNMTLTPAYDICPQGRSGHEASQAMLISGDNRSSKLSTCLGAAKYFLLSEGKAKAVFEKQKDIINGKWGDICDEAELSEIDRKYLWRRQFLNPFATDED